MEPFTTHTGVGVPLRRSNVDTDQIIPAVYLKRVTRTGFEDGLFAAWRADEHFVLNIDIDRALTQFEIYLGRFENDRLLFRIDRAWRELNLEFAAMVLGSRPTAVLFRLTLPILRPAIIASAVFAFTLSFVNVPLSLFLSPSNLRPLPIVIYQEMINTRTPSLAAVSVLLAFVLLATTRHSWRIAVTLHPERLSSAAPNSAKKKSPIRAVNKSSACPTLMAALVETSSPARPNAIPRPNCCSAASCVKASASRPHRTSSRSATAPVTNFPACPSPAVL